MLIKITIVKVSRANLQVCIQSNYNITTIYTFNSRSNISTECPADAISTHNDPHYDTIHHTVFDPLIPTITPITLVTLHSYVQRISQDSSICKKYFEVKNVYFAVSYPIFLY